MEEELYKKINRMEAQINELYKTAQTVKKIIIWSVVLSILLFILPLIALVFVLPTLLSTMSGMYSGL